MSRLNVERLLDFRVRSHIEMEKYYCWKDQQDRLPACFTGLAFGCFAFENIMIGGIPDSLIMAT